ncbi:3544_t:CDS:2 [Cetraspora pellucida]|uniref:3544_t:CDS:1 n=1 Tax=Cetraspora pellucida TaxID=1433469 RepID=A0A9N8VY74_9GLOM|nr:3544_t:CDS:2 [Cetraspora pellucida]
MTEIAALHYNQKKPKIRSYTPLACTNCRIKKEKCSGPLPKSDRATVTTPEICNLLNPSN